MYVEEEEYRCDCGATGSGHLRPGPVILVYLVGKEGSDVTEYHSST
jgi:hypothetical protein